MAAIRKFARFTDRTRFLNKYYFASQNGSFCTMVQPQRTQGLMKLGLIGAVTGAAIGAGYAYYKIGKARNNIFLEGTQLETVLLEHKPPVTPSRKVFRSRCKKLHVALFTSRCLTMPVLVPGCVTGGFHRFEAHVIPVSDVSFLL